MPLREASAPPRGCPCDMICTCGTRRKLQTPGTAEEHKRQGKPTINPNDRQPTQLTDQAPGTIERAARESRNTAPISTAAAHTFSTATTRHHYPHPTGSSPDPLSQRSPLRSTDEPTGGGADEPTDGGGGGGGGDLHLCPVVRGQDKS